MHVPVSKQFLQSRRVTLGAFPECDQYEPGAARSCVATLRVLLAAMRGPGESYNDVIIHIAKG